MRYVRDLLHRMIGFSTLVLSGYLRFLKRVWPTEFFRTIENLTASTGSSVTAIETLPSGTAADVILRFDTSFELGAYRANTFYTKEPETLEWMEAFGGADRILFDVGANVGLYSIYYAIRFRSRVIAFEPSPFNIRALTTNIGLNGVQDNIDLISMPLTDGWRIENFSMSDIRMGSALASFGATYGPDGEPLQVIQRVRLLGSSLDSLLDLGVLGEHPSLLKIDVDGIEHLVLRGASETLRSPKLKSVLIEVDERFSQAAREISDMLADAGFKLEGKYRSELFESSQWSSIWNQIWVR